MTTASDVLQLNSDAEVERPVLEHFDDSAEQPHSLGRGSPTSSTLDIALSDKFLARNNEGYVAEAACPGTAPHCGVFLDPAPTLERGQDVVKERGQGAKGRISEVLSPGPSSTSSC